MTPTPAGIAGALSASLQLALNDIADFDRRGAGYAWNWRPKAREKLQAMGYVGPLETVFRHGQNIKVCRLTDLGREVAAELQKRGDGQ